MFRISQSKKKGEDDDETDEATGIIAHKISQLKYASKQDETFDIFDTLRENLAFLKSNKFLSQTKASIIYSLEINPKLTLRNFLNNKIEKSAPG